KARRDTRSPRADKAARAAGARQAFLVRPAAAFPARAPSGFARRQIASHRCYRFRETGAGSLRCPARDKQRGKPKGLRPPWTLDLPGIESALVETTGELDGESADVPCLVGRRCIRPIGAGNRRGRELLRP